MEQPKDYNKETRNSSYQKVFFADKLRRSREEHLVTLRKLKRKDAAIQKRALLQHSQAGGYSVSDNVPEFLQFDLSWISSDLQIKYPSISDPSLTPGNRLLMLINYIESLSDLNDLYSPILTLRKVLSNDGVPPVHFIMNSSISAKLISLLKSSSPLLKKECMWCILNIATGPPHVIKKIIEHDIVAPLKLILGEKDNELVDLCIWCIGNLAGESVIMRDKLICLVPVIIELVESTSIETIKIISWALSNLFRGKPAPERRYKAQMLKLLPKLLEFTDETVLAECCWALSYISDGDLQTVDEIFEANILNTVLKLLDREVNNITSPCLRFLGNIVAGSELHSKKALKLGLIDKISAFLASSNTSIQKEVLWMISNITAGDDEEINNVLSHPCFTIVMDCLAGPDLYIKNEALWVIANATHTKNPDIIKKILDGGALTALLDILEFKESKIIMVALEAISCILKSGYSEPLGLGNKGIDAVFDELGGLEKLERLQKHPNTRIYNKVVEIIDEHYGLIEVDEEYNPPGPEKFFFN